MTFVIITFFTNGENCFTGVGGEVATFEGGGLPEDFP
jgi:hypothetical protein